MKRWNVSNFFLKNISNFGWAENDNTLCAKIKVEYKSF